MKTSLKEFWRGLTNHPDTPPSNRTLWLWIGTVVLGVAVLACWVIYAVNPNFLTYCLVVGVPALCSLALYHFKPGVTSESFLVALNTLVACIACVTHPGLLSISVGVVMALLLMRTLLVYMRGSEREAILESFRRVEEPVKVNDRLMLRLNPNERYRIVTHWHEIHVVGWWLLMGAWGAFWVTAPLFHGLSAMASLVAFIIGEIVLGIKPTLFGREYLCVTTQYRLFVLRGILKQTTPGTAVQKLTDTNPIITRTSTILSWLRIIKAPYGYYVLETAGQTQSLTKIGPIPDIKAFERVINQMVTPRADEGPLE